MTKLFNRVFASLPEDVQRDHELFEKMALLQQFIHPENLDIKPVFRNETSWLVCGEHLFTISFSQQLLVLFFPCRYRLCIAFLSGCHYCLSFWYFFAAGFFNRVSLRDQTNFFKLCLFLFDMRELH